MPRARGQSGGAGSPATSAPGAASSPLCLEPEDPRAPDRTRSPSPSPPFRILAHRARGHQERPVGGSAGVSRVRSYATVDAEGQALAPEGSLRGMDRLLQLQELDLSIDRVTARLRELEVGEDVRSIRTALGEAEARLGELRLAWTRWGGSSAGWRETSTRWSERSRPSAAGCSTGASPIPRSSNRSRPRSETWGPGSPTPRTWCLNRWNGARTCTAG